MRKLIIILLILISGICYGQGNFFWSYPKVNTGCNTQPTITITSSSSDYTSIYVSYTITTGCPTATEQGLCWNTSGTPTTSDNTLSETVGNGADNITGLTSNTTYHIRAYIISTLGTFYSGEIIRTTLNIGDYAHFSQFTLQSTTSSSITCQSIIDSDGGTAITERGICWSTTNHTPTKSDNYVTVSPTTGSINTTVSGLNSFTNYWWSAYAINSKGIVYISAGPWATN